MENLDRPCCLSLFVCEHLFSGWGNVITWSDEASNTSEDSIEDDFDVNDRERPSTIGDWFKCAGDFLDDNFVNDCDDVKEEDDEDDEDDEEKDGDDDDDEEDDDDDEEDDEGNNDNDDDDGK